MDLAAETHCQCAAHLEGVRAVNVCCLKILHNKEARAFLVPWLTPEQKGTARLLYKPQGFHRNFEVGKM